MTAEIIQVDGLTVSRWRNGAGRKADIATTADWHVGFAWLDAAAPFSDFTGNDRTITLIEGDGFELDFKDKPTLRVAALYQPSPFDGGWPTLCSLIGGPCVVLNAMTARFAYRHSVVIADLAALPALASDPATVVFLVVLVGTATMDDGTELQPRDTLRISGPLALRGSPGARAAVITITNTPGPT